MASWEERCGHVYHGLFYGYMCRRKPGHTGRHMWWIDLKKPLYWRNTANG